MSQRTIRTMKRGFPPPLSYQNVCTLSTVSLSSMITACVRDSRLEAAQELFDQNPQLRDVISWNSLVAGYARNDQMRRAQEMFDQMPVRDVVSWNTILMGFQRTKDLEGVMQYFLKMVRTGLRPTEFTLSTVISAISNTGFQALIPYLHARTIVSAFNSNVFVGSALMGGYANLGCQISLRRVFDEIYNKEISSWNALISAYMGLGCVADARKAFATMPKRNVVTWTALINGFIDNKMLEEARSKFDRMPERPVISWTVMISGYQQNGHFVDALEMFVLMRKSGTRPNHFTFSSVLSASAGCSSILTGKQVHDSILKSGLRIDVILSTSLVDMYAKCGDINAAFEIFEAMPRKNLVSWNSILGGYARHGLGARAVEEFKRMMEHSVRPNYVTFINVLSACGHGGLTEEGEKLFASMETKHGIQARMEHYACMVDLFGRAGQLEKAEKLIKEMPFEPDVVVWGALLGACGMHSSLELGVLAAKGMYRIEQEHPAVYSILSKMHGERGGWSSIIGLRNMMKERGIKKQKASSWIESSVDMEQCSKQKKNVIVLHAKIQ